MDNNSSFKWFFRLLTTKEGRRILLIPIIILIALSAFSIYQMELNSKPERVEIQDGSGDVRLTKRSSISSFKLPKEDGEIRDIIGEDVKVTYYDVLYDKDNNIKSATVSIKSDEAGAQDIISSYKDKYNLEKGVLSWDGNANGYDISINYYAKDQRVDINLKKLVSN